MKTYRTNYDIAHAFAYGATDGHTGSRNQFIEGNCIYSYGWHFCIAKRVGKGTILMTTRAYSKSTAEHIAYVKGATSHMNRIYCYNPGGTHNENQKEFLREINELLPYLAKARKPEKWIHEIQVICARAAKYCDFFGIKMNKDLAKFVDSEDYNKINDEYVAELKKIAEKEIREGIKKKKESLVKWHNFETSHAPCLDFQELRVNENKNNRIETTMGVEIPLEMGREFYDRLKAGEVKEGDKLFYYSVIRINENEIRVGCHKFKIKYLLDFGKRVFDNAS